MKKFFRSSMATAFFFVLSILLLSVGTIGGTRAALQIESNEYESQISMRNIGVTLTENGVDRSYRNYDKTAANGKWYEETKYLVENMVKDAGDTALKIGKTYPFALSIRNSGSIPEYARVTIYKYWVDPTGQILDYGWFNGNGVKQVYLDPAWIEIELDNTSSWQVDEEASTDERIVLDYVGNGGILEVNEAAAALTKSLTINSEITKVLAQKTDNTGNLTGNYFYAAEGIGFVVEAQVDAVQTQNSEKAIPSAWGHS